MSRRYDHIKKYEKEIIELKEQGLTLREIGELYGFSYKQVHNFITRYNANQKWVTDISYIKTGQGFQYTSQAYFNLTQSYGIKQSMSRRGNPYDNALAENFFSILKTECIHRVKLATYEEARLLINEYINFYNNYRIQTKTKLTPLEKRNQFVA